MSKRLEVLIINPAKDQKILFPVNPEQIDYPTQREYKIYNILDYGEVHMPAETKLRKITIKNVFPEDNSNFALTVSMFDKISEKIYSQQNAIKFLTEWIEKKYLVRLIVSDYINMLCRVTSFTRGIKENTTTMTSTIELIEYRTPNIVYDSSEEETGSNLTKLKKRAINKIAKGDKKLATKGMTIYKMAKLNCIENYKELAKLNNIVDVNADIAGKYVELWPIE